MDGAGESEVVTGAAVPKHHSVSVQERSNDTAAAAATSKTRRRSAPPSGRRLHSGTRWHSDRRRSRSTCGWTTMGAAPITVIWHHSKFTSYYVVGVERLLMLTRIPYVVSADAHALQPGSPARRPRHS